MATVGLVLARKTASAPRDLVWAHVVDAELRQVWWPGSQVEASLGGSVSEQWSDGAGDSEVVRDASGVIDVCISGHVLGFRWRDAADEFETEVLLTLRSGESTADGSADSAYPSGAVGASESTDITVSETGFGRFADASERIADAQQGWIELLTALVTTVEAAVETADSAPGENLAPYEENRSEASPDAPTSPDAEPDSTEVGEDDSEAEIDAEAEPNVEPEAELKAESEAETESESETEAELSFDDLIRGA
ncbi:SRPBCC family protein [Leucobacter denitrificans]|uniref:SRPBCC domain-containing protein n=1 Tax=Leucobacter denitrificans TaxID=683042 RepID=A0A7G9S724_9MICO|nr:hypothetical protein [Leucobacter denitrificans]QNN63649.1 hypothetical protein H9L06_04935 [Leucobacter denitrificans]